MRRPRLDRSGSLRRRLVTIPIVFLAWILIWAASPLLIAASAVADAIRRREAAWMATRLVLFAMAYTTAEVAGLVALSAVWVGAAGKSSRLRRGTFAVQQTWAGFVFWSVRRIFGLRLTVAGAEMAGTPPYVLLARHASIVDNLLPAHLVSRPHNLHIRYVMKEELRWDPALDVAGSRLPNCFVRRGAGESDREIAAIRRLGETMGPDEAVLIYPEGTRFTDRKRESALGRLARRSSRLHEMASTLRSVLPPRPGGTLALLEACDADVVVMAHRGLDGFARIRDVWDGGMVRTPVEVEFWRIPRSAIPEGRSARMEWLFGLWQELDEWITADRAGSLT